VREGINLVPHAVVVVGLAVDLADYLRCNRQPDCVATVGGDELLEPGDYQITEFFCTLVCGVGSPPGRGWGSWR